MKLLVLLSLVVLVSADGYCFIDGVRQWKWVWGYGETSEKLKTTFLSGSVYDQDDMIGSGVGWKLLQKRWHNLHINVDVSEAQGGAQSLNLFFWFNGTGYEKAFILAGSANYEPGEFSGIMPSWSTNWGSPTYTTFTPC